ncbi:MAG: hypothetical protein WD230_01910 [Cucumibacter sp.]
MDSTLEREAQAHAEIARGKLEKVLGEVRRLQDETSQMDSTFEQQAKTFEQQANVHAEIARGKLEKVLGEVRRLQDESSQRAGEEFDKLENKIAKFKYGFEDKDGALDAAGAALSDGARKAWKDISGAANKASRVMKREFNSLD